MAMFGKKNAVLIPILILFGINIILTATNVTRWIAENNFRAFSENKTTSLAQRLRPQIVAATAELPANAAPQQIKLVLDPIILSGALVAYAYTDRQGHLVLTSKTRSRGVRFGRIFDERIFSRVGGLDRRSSGNDPRQEYGHADITLPETGPIGGDLRIFIDQADARALFNASHKNMTVISALFLAAALSLVIFVVWVRIKEQWRADDRIRHLAHHDGLTDLPKREVFIRNLNHELSRIERGSGLVALLCLDVDNFKQINDTMGHAVGDALLKQFSARMRENTRKTDLLCRMGGDEFAIALCGLKTVERIVPFANRLCEILGEPYTLNGHRFATSASIGVAIAPDDSNDATALFHFADLALYRAKAAGRNAVRFFESGMNIAFQQRLHLERDLMAAIEGNQFVLYYQPQHDMNNNDLIGYEALVRWVHPNRGIVPPGEFVPIAEDTGLIVPLSHWILERACKEAADWDPGLKLAVNLSPLQFGRESVADLVAGTLEKTDFPANRLELEITESVLMTRTAPVAEELYRLKELGVQIVIDDFGTGYSSLCYLARFPFDKIKIDRSFLSDLSTNPQTGVIVRTIIGLGHNLNITITAEGIETREQESMLRSWGCDQGQGFLYGRPACHGTEVQHDCDDSVVLPSDRPLILGGAV